MIDLVWLVCAFEFLSYIIPVLMWLFTAKSGNAKVDKAWLTRNGRFVRNATAAEIKGIENNLNTRPTYTGTHPIVDFYGEGAFITGIFVVILYFVFFWGAEYPLPIPGLLLVAAFLVVHCIIHMRVAKAYSQTASNALKRFAIAIFVYKFLVASGAVLGGFSNDIGTQYQYTDSKYEDLYQSYMLFVLASWPIAYGIFCLWYARVRKATNDFRRPGKA